MNNLNERIATIDGLANMSELDWFKSDSLCLLSQQWFIEYINNKRKLPNFSLQQAEFAAWDYVEKLLLERHCSKRYAFLGGMYTYLMQATDFDSEIIANVIKHSLANYTE